MNSATRLVLVVASLVLVAAACGSDSKSASGVSVADAWVRQPAQGQPSAAAYGTITNDTNGDVTFVSVTSPLSSQIEIHETTMGSDGSMSMKEKAAGYVIQAGKSLVLEPGGAHVMINDVAGATLPNPVPMTWVFEDSSGKQTEVQVQATLRSLDAP